MYWAFVVNPTAGTGFAVKTMKNLEERLRKTGIEYKTFLTERPGHATKIASALAKQEKVYTVVAVGGDGTAAEVAAGLCKTGKPMGIIPAGTGNDFIKSVGIPNDPSKALDLMLSRQPIDTDTGTVNGKFFLNVCGTGFDVTVLDYAESLKDKHRGMTPYFIGLLKAIFHYESVHLKVTADGKTEEGRYLVCSIANGRYIGGGIPICPQADPTDGKLNLVLIQHRPPSQPTTSNPGPMMSRDLDFKITDHRFVSLVRIEGRNLRINIDGEICSMDSAEFCIHPASLRLIR